MPTQIIDADPARPVDDLASKLAAFGQRPVILLIGSIVDGKAAIVEPLFRHAILPLAYSVGAVILDEGSPTDLAGLIDRVAPELDHPPLVVSVTSSGAAPLNSHEAVINLHCAEPDRYKLAFQLAEQLAKSEENRALPALVILSGGGVPEQKAVQRCPSRSWPVLVLQGTGGLADDIAKAFVTGAPPADGNQPTPAVEIKDVELRSIIDNTRLYFVDATQPSMADLTNILRMRLELRTDALEAAWLCHDRLNAAAGIRQRRFRFIELLLLVLAVIATFFAILQSTSKSPASALTGLQNPLHNIVLVIPICITIVAAYNTHFRDGYKWILLRGAAETVKREIFRYRAQAGAYNDESCRTTSRELKLATAVKNITDNLEASEVNKVAFPAAVPRLDAASVTQRSVRLAFVTPNEYIEQRIDDQIGYYENKTRKLARQLLSMQVCIYVAGAAGTLLAAIKLDIWVALATAAVTALTTKLQTDQIENNLVHFNKTLNTLRNIRIWWMSLSSWEKGHPNNIDVLVEQSERALESESAGWLEQMQGALDELTHKEQPRPGQPQGQGLGNSERKPQN